MATAPLIINNWTDGIGDSADTGFAIIQNASIDAVPGTITPNYMPSLATFPNATSTFTWDPSGTLDLTTSGTSLETDGVPVTFSTAGGGTLDSNIVAGTIYFLYKFATGRVIISPSTNAALNHSPLSLAGNGSGTCTVTVVGVGTINQMCTAPQAVGSGTSVVYAFDSNGRVWYGNDGSSQFYLLPGNTSSSPGVGVGGISSFINSNGSAIYLFVYRSNAIDVCDISTQAKRRDPVGNSTWTNSWQSLNTSSVPHYALLGYDNITYSLDGRYVNAIQEVPGQVFAPGTGSTYSFNSKALTLPAVTQGQSIEQFGQTLLIGDLNTNLIFPWDRVSPSFNLPILCPEIGIYGMKNIGNIVWIAAGTRGNVYSTLGYFVEVVRKVPEQLTQSISGGSNTVQWGGMSQKSGALLFGISGLSGYAATILMFPDGRMVQDSQPSQGQTLPTAYVPIQGEFYWTGYAGGIDVTSTNRFSSLANSLAISKLYKVGTKVGQATFSLLECQLDQPGQSGGQVRISYRTDTSSSFTVLATYTLDGVSTSFDSDIGLTGIQNIQVKVEVASTTGGPSGSEAARVLEVRLLAGSH